MAQVRDSVFQIILNHVHVNNLQQEELRFLDLFSGSGLMALEAVSRGFDAAVSVEKDPIKWRTIEENFSLDSSALRLVRSSAERFVLGTNNKFHVLYLDPPFEYRYKEDLLRKVEKSRLLYPKSLVLIHMPTKEAFSTERKSLVLTKTRVFGASTVYFFQTKPEA